MMTALDLSQSKLLGALTLTALEHLARHIVVTGPSRAISSWCCCRAGRSNTANLTLLAELRRRAPDAIDAASTPLRSRRSAGPHAAIDGRPLPTSLPPMT